MVSHAHMLAGTDESGERIPIFTATLTGEQAIKAGVGSFQYVGESTESNDPNAKLAGKTRHGHGEAIYQSESKYVGEWVNDKRSGRGQYIFPCGDTYDGGWKNGKYHGHGKYTTSAKHPSDEYEGEWEADKMHGLGKYHYSAEGDVYDGAWTAGLRSGKGKYSFSNGNYFEGEYQFGERHGVGTFHYVTGEAEVSRYIEGRESGWGAIWSADRQTAWRLDEGSADGTISLDEAESIAHGLGLTVPGVSVVTDSSPAAITAILPTPASTSAQVHTGLGFRPPVGARFGPDGRASFF